jgi:hypothetical protein
MLKPFHIDTLAGEANAFEGKARALFPGGRSAQLYFAACAQYAMPGKLISGVGAQKPGYGTVIARIAGSRGNSAVGADLAGGNGENHAAKGAIARLVRSQGILEQSAFGLLHGERVDGDGAGWRLLAGFGDGAPPFRFL